MKLQGQVAIVAGGGQGLGEGIVRCLAEEGANISVIDINGEEAGKRTVRCIGKFLIKHLCHHRAEAFECRGNPSGPGALPFTRFRLKVKEARAGLFRKQIADCIECRRFFRLECTAFLKEIGE